MPARCFTCPDKTEVPILECLQNCRAPQRCLFLPTLRQISASLERNIQGFSVTELLNGTREMYLKKTKDYTVDPMKCLYAIQGSAAHLLHQGHSDGNILSEERLYGDHCSGQIDCYGSILDSGTATLGDLKVTSSYKIMRALGLQKIKTATGEFYKSGPRKGQEKFVSVIRDGAVRHIWDWAVQMNCYRVLLEQQGFPVNRLVVQAFCRDQGLQIATSRGIEQQAYFIDVHPISDRWLNRFVKAKANKLQYALDNNVLPPPCNARERWHNRKCLGYCEVAGFCSYAQSLKKTTDKVA